MTGRGIGYVRVSTDTQDVTRQYVNIKLWLQSHSLAPVRILEDAGRRHHPESRKAFQELIRLAQAREIDWIIIDNRDRFGFGHPHQ